MNLWLPPVHNSRASIQLLAGMWRLTSNPRQGKLELGFRKGPQDSGVELGGQWVGGNERFSTALYPYAKSGFSIRTSFPSASQPRDKTASAGSRDKEPASW